MIKGKMTNKITVNQILPTIKRYDAISDEIFVIKSLLIRHDYNSEIYAENIDPTLTQYVKNISLYFSNDDDRNTKNTIFIYHHGIGSSNLIRFIDSIASKIIMIYHNITPAGYFLGYNNQLALLTERGREQLKTLRSKTAVAIADSDYNRKELEELGYKNTYTMPILMDFSKYNVEPKKYMVEQFQNSTNILFVGRIAPNKKIEDVIKVFVCYNRLINTDSNLFIVGDYDEPYDRYYDAVREMVRRAKVEDKVHFIKNADYNDLATLYSLADVYLSMSEHEGFGVPFVEAMYFRVPIIAYNCSAIPYTLGRSALIVNKKNYEEMAELIRVVTEDEHLKKQVIELQYNRLKELTSANNKNILLQAIDNVVCELFNQK